MDCLAVRIPTIVVNRRDNSLVDVSLLLSVSPGVRRPCFMGFAIFIADVFFLSESFAPRLLQLKAAKIRLQTKKWAVRSKLDEGGVDLKQFATVYLTRPISGFIPCSPARTLNGEDFGVLTVPSFSSQRCWRLNLCYSSSQSTSPSSMVSYTSFWEPSRSSESSSLLSKIKSFFAYPPSSSSRAKRFQLGRRWIPGVGDLPFLAFLIGVSGGGVIVALFTPRYVRKQAANGGWPVPEER